MSQAGHRDLDQVLAATHLPALDGVRAVAVSIVILSHSRYGGLLKGDLGVNAFFVLSGFLITWLLMREQGETGSISLRDFYVRRTLRIFPAYYVFLAASFAADTWFGQGWTLGLGLAAVFYAMNYYNAFLGHPITSLSHCWSLAVEEQFYLLWPVAFRALARRGARSLAVSLVAATLGVMAWRCLLYFGFGVGHAYLYNAFDTRFDNLAVGCLIAVGLRDARVRKLGSSIARSQLLPLLPISLLWLSRTRSPDAWHYGPGFTVDAVLIAVILVQLLQLSHAPLWRWLEHPVTRYLGRISYPMYLWHAWGEAVGRHTVPGSPGLWTLLGFGFTILLASGSYAFVEKPFLRLKRRYELAQEGSPATSV